MSGAICAICLEDLKEPMSVPCGHVHCYDCLEQHIQTSGDDAFESNCPTCRAPFTLVVPVMRHVPERYHKFITPTIRRIYLEAPEGNSQHAEVEALRARIQALEREASRRERHARTQLATERALREEAEEQFEQERLARGRAEKLLTEEYAMRKRAVRECSTVKTEYVALKKELEKTTESRKNATRLYEDICAEYDDLEVRFRQEQTERAQLQKKLVQASARRDALEQAYTDLQNEYSHKLTLSTRATAFQSARSLSASIGDANTSSISRALGRTPLPANTLSMATLPGDSDTEEEPSDDEAMTPPLARRTIRPLPRRAALANEMEFGSQGVRRPREEDEPEIPGMHKRTRLVRPLEHLLRSSAVYTTGPSTVKEDVKSWDGSFLSTSSTSSRTHKTCTCSNCRVGA